MIRYDLVCENGHRFDAWFRDSGDFDRQAEAGYLSCPNCATTDVAKALMTPGVRTARDRAKPRESDGSEASSAPVPVKAPARPAPPAMLKEAAMRQMMARVYEHVTKTSRDVGTAFAREARRQHEGEAAEEPIFGQASNEEVRDLLDDGIAILPLPVPPKSDA